MYREDGGIMRNKDTKRTYFMYLPYECSAVEEYLEKMAEKGWLLESTKRGFFKFKKIETRKIKYSVDVLDRVSVFDHNDSDVALDYREYCKAAGWTYICEDGGTQFFYTESDSEIISIHTDEEEKFKVVFKSSMKNVYGQMLFIILLISSVYMQLANNTEVLSTNTDAIGLVLLVSIILRMCIDIINFYIWVAKAKGQLKANQKMPYNSYKQLKRKNILVRTYNLLLIFIFLMSLISDIPGSNKFNIPMVLIMLVPYIILGNVKKFTDKKDYTKDSNMGIYIGSTLVLLLVMFVLSSVFGNTTNNKQSVVSSEKASLTIMDFGYKRNEDKNSYNYKNSYIEFDESILAQRTKYSSQNVNVSMEYTIFESQYPWLIKLQENSVVSRYKKYFSFKEEKTSLPSNIRAYFGSSSRSFIVLVSEDKVIFIVKNIGVSEEEFLKKAYEKLLN